MAGFTGVLIIFNSVCFLLIKIIVSIKMEYCFGASFIYCLLETLFLKCSKLAYIDFLVMMAGLEVGAQLNHTVNLPPCVDVNQN